MSKTPRDSSQTLSAGGTSAVARESLPLLFESSWEVCSQAGGIYTVIRSKAPVAVSRWGGNYLCLGPYRDHSRVEFEPTDIEGPLGDVIRRFRESGLPIHFGRWLITGRPRTILIDHRPLHGNLPEMKYYMWKDCGISLPPDDPETDEVVAFGYCVADFFQALVERLGRQPVIAHFHEWQAGAALPLLAFRKVHLSTVFTTHATLVGRSLSAANEDLYSQLDSYDPDKVAVEHGIKHRFDIERAAARHADIFTTVSEITSQEAEAFLGRRAEVVLPNGLNIERFAAPHEFQNLHQRFKQRIHEFVMGHFFPSYSFALDRTLYFFTAGRYEFRNKGMDVFIESLYELNRRLKAQSEDITVVAFIVTRAPYHGFNVDTLNRQAMFKELKNTCGAIQEEMGRLLFRSVAEGRLPTTDDLLDEYARVRLKRMMYAWREGPTPGIVTHELVDSANDPVLRHIRHRQLLNAADDPVKVIFHPEFMSPTNPIIGLEYDQFVRGCNLGVFPSYYEPWGYTPMECVVRGVPAITSDLSGFGAYVQEHLPDHDENGLFVSHRKNTSFETTVYQLTGWLHNLCRMSLRERISMRNRIEAYADAFDWSDLTRHYRRARRLAFEKRYPDQRIPPLEELRAR